MTFSEFGEMLRNLIPPPEEIATLIETDIKQRINQQVDLSGAPIPPVKPSTALNKSKHGMSNKTLIGDGTLLNSIKVKADKDYKITLQCNVPYASYMQDRYNFMGISDDVMKTIEDKIRQRSLQR